MKAFTEFGLAPALIQAIKDMGFVEPTPVQSKVIPILLKDERDIVALAQTGTGKTAAFGLPLLQLTDPTSNDVQALVLCPTRELCLQIAGDLADYCKHTPGIRTVAVYGGAPIDAQLRGLSRGAHIIVATPGRMNDVMRRRRGVLAKVQRVILDEADEMLKMGFMEDLEAILNEVPDTARTLLFSATMPTQVAVIASKYMDNPEEITIGQRNAGSANVSHECYVVHARDRYAALKRIIDFHRDIYGIVFCRTRIDTQDVAARLMADGYNADALHGDLSQAQRDRVMKNFRTRQIQLLVATDVAARGLDVDDLTHIINYCLPDELQAYTHRSGRTGRAGKEGISIAIVNMREEFKIKAIERMVKKSFQYKQVPSGRDVGQAKFADLMEKIKLVKVDDSRLDPYMATITAALGDMPKEELIKRFLLKEADRFLSYYHNAPDLNAKSGHEPHRQVKGRMTDREFSPAPGQGQDRGPRPERQVRERLTGTTARLMVNLGAQHAMTPAALISVINRVSPGPMQSVGKIWIMEQTSVFEVSPAHAAVLVPAMNSAKFDGYPMHVVPEDGPRRDYGSSPTREARDARKPYARGHFKGHRTQGWPAYQGQHHKAGPHAGSAHHASPSRYPGPALHAEKAPHAKASDHAPHHAHKAAGAHPPAFKHAHKS